MANIGAHGAKQMLDWVLGGAAATQPASRLAALSLGTPSITSGSEHNTNLGYARQTAIFSPANSNLGAIAASVINSSAMTFGPFSSSTAIQGLLIYDTISISSGNIWWYGTLLTARTVLPGDTLVVAAGALIITLS